MATWRFKSLLPAALNRIARLYHSLLIPVGALEEPWEHFPSLDLVIIKSVFSINK